MILISLGFRQHPRMLVISSASALRSAPVALIQNRQGERHDRPVFDEEARQRVELAVPIRYRALPPPSREGPERGTRVLGVRREVQDVVAGPPQQESEQGPLWIFILQPERFIQ